MITKNGLLVDSGPADEAPLTAEDPALWFDEFAALVRSHVDFLLADFRGDADVVNRAADVLVWRNGRFSTVRELIDVCASHRWNVMIYEAWAWETAQRVRTLIRSLDAKAAHATEIYARHLGYFDVDASEMQEAIYEAKKALEGDLQ